MGRKSYLNMRIYCCNTLYIVLKNTRKKLCHFLQPFRMCKVLKSCTVTGRYLKPVAYKYIVLNLESRDGSRSCCSYRLLNMPERRPWCDFTTAAVTGADMIFLWAIRIRYVGWGLGLGGGVRLRPFRISSVIAWRRKLLWFLDWTAWMWCG